MITVILHHYTCGHLLQQQQDANTAAQETRNVGCLWGGEIVQEQEREGTQ